MARPSLARALARAVLRQALPGRPGPEGADQREIPDTKGAKGVVMRVASKVAGIVYPTNASGNSMSVR